MLYINCNKNRECRRTASCRFSVLCTPQECRADGQEYTLRRSLHPEEVPDQSITLMDVILGWSSGATVPLSSCTAVSSQILSTISMPSVTCPNAA